MPLPVSQAQFRFLGAVRSGNARDAHGLSPASAKAGMEEFEKSGRKFKNLPKRAIRRKVAEIRAGR